MTEGRYDEIVFSNIPAVAHFKWKKALKRDTNSNGEKSDSREELSRKYKEYLEDVKKGEKKINSKGIQPHILVNNYLQGCEIDETVEAQWKAIATDVKEKGIFNRALSIVDDVGRFRSAERAAISHRPGKPPAGVVAAGEDHLAR